MEKMSKIEKAKKRLILLDSHAIIHRAYHALPDFSSSNGESTGALYGLSAMLMKIVSDLKPDYIIAAYDLPEQTHRHRAFDEYKAGRQKTDDNLVHQIERSRDIFAVFSIPIYEKGGFEADDIIGTIVEQVKNDKRLEVIIASGDMDTLQLVDGTRVSVYTLRKGIKDTVVYDEKEVKNRFGFEPCLIPDYKGLRGDPSDNIPGIPGIGEKSATQLITLFGDIDSIYKTLKKDSKSFEKKGIKPRMINLLQSHEDDARFSRELAEIRRDAPISFVVPKRDWFSSVDTTKALALFSELGFKTLSQRFRTLFNVDEQEVVHADLKEVTDIVTEEELKEIGIALWVLNSEYTSSTTQDILAYTNQSTIAEAKKYILNELKKQNLEKIYVNIELPLIPVIRLMSEYGTKIDIDYLKKLSKDYHIKLDRFAREIYKLAGTEFNINSPRQLGEILYDKLGLSGKARTATGQRSTRESELQKLRSEHKIIQCILSYRELQKLLSTYIDTLPALVSPADGRLHADFLQTGTTTGRLSSQNPNLQNIPIRTDLGKAVRNTFITEKDFSLVAIDYSQIELRVAAAITSDEKMKTVFVEGGDIHGVVAEEVFGNSDSDSRRKAKAINFGILYGMGVNALARAIDAPRKEAQQFLDDYFNRFPGVANHIESTKQFVHKNGYTETIFGRRRYFPGIQSHLPYVRAEAERMAINAPIQGTAADIIKLAMTKVDNWIEKKKLREDVHLVLQIHDELVYEIRKSKVQSATNEIRKTMENIVSKERLNGVPLVVDVSVGDNWGQMEKL